MAVDYMEVMTTLGAITGKHPQTVASLMQTYSVWNAKSAENAKIAGEYQAAAAKATGPMDIAGVIMQLAALHPWFIPMIQQTLAQYQSRIPDLIQVLGEIQDASIAAAKT